MATLLYVTAHPLEGGTHSLSVGKQFIETYHEANPDDEIVHLDLYRSEIPQIDADILKRWGQPPSGPSFDELSIESKAKALRMRELVDQFIAADKVVFVNPVWNYSVPPILKAYIDSITVPGVTFKSAGNGQRGLGGLVGSLTDTGKKVTHIQASGTVMSHGRFQEVEFSHSYLKAAMKFIGIDSVDAIFVEGTSEYKDQADDILKHALEQATELAKNF